MLVYLLKLRFGMFATLDAPDANEKVMGQTGFGFVPLAQGLGRKEIKI